MYQLRGYKEDALFPRSRKQLPVPGVGKLTAISFARDRGRLEILHVRVDKFVSSRSARGPLIF